MTDPLPALLSRAWDILAQGAAARDAPARTLALATTAPDGAPQLRSVILRAFDRADATLDIHTDARTPKVAALRHDDRAAALVWHPDDRLQLRLTGRIAILTEPAAWDRVPPAARVSYGTTPAPGTPIAGPFAYAAQDGAPVFTILRLVIDSLDLLHLGDRHSRALFRRDDGWQGTWLSP